MLLKQRREPFDGAGWLLEPKWGGWRALAMVQDGLAAIQELPAAGAPRHDRHGKRGWTIGPPSLMMARCRKFTAVGCMSLLARIWLALCANTATVLVFLAVLLVMQHDALLSQLIRQRLGVTIEASAAPFRSIVELGLPISMVRNADELLRRTGRIDGDLTAIHVFNPTGIVVRSVGAETFQQVPDDVLAAQRHAGGSERWSVETAESLVSGVSILGERGSVVGGIVAFYPKAELESQSRQLRREMGLAALLVASVACMLALLLLRLRLSGTLRGVAALDELARRTRADHGRLDVDTRRFGFLKPEFERLLDQTERAGIRYGRALEERGGGHAAEPRADGTPPVALVSSPETPLARGIARRLTPLAALLVIGAALALGGFAYDRIERSLAPEFERRAELIGTIAGEAIGRALQAGIPMDALVGSEQYLADLLRQFPEMASLQIRGDGALLSVGEPSGGAVSRLPIIVGDIPVAEVSAELDPAYLAEQFRNVVLDVAVIILVVVVFAFELIVLLMSRSFSGTFDRVLFLATLQAEGDFSKRLALRGKGALERLGEALSERSERIGALLAERRSDVDGFGGQAAAHASARPAILRFCSLTDVRLALFLFTAADQLPLSFFSLYVRAADNPFSWLNPGLVISLPLAGYLTAAMAGSAFARLVARRLGHRTQFLVASALAAIANIGLFAAAGVPAIIFWSVLNGLGFALAALACQDYVIDRLPGEERSRSLALLAAALFGGVLAGTALGGIVADRIGQRPVFLISAALVITSAALVLWLMPRGRRAAGKTSKAFSFNLLAPLASRRFSALALGIVIPQAVADQVFVSYLVALAMDALGASIADIARLMIVYFLLLMLSSALYGRLPRRYAMPAPIAVVAGVLAGLSLLVAAGWPSQWSYLLAGAAAGLGHGLSRGPQSELALEVAEGELALLGPDSVLGAVRVLERGGSVLGLLAIGVITGAVGHAGASGAIGLTLLTGTALFAVTSFAARDHARSAGGEA